MEQENLYSEKETGHFKVIKIELLIAISMELVNKIAINKKFFRIS